MRHASARASQSNLVCLFVYVVSAFAAVVVSGAAAAADPLFDQAFDALAHQEYADSLRAAGFRGSVRPSAYRGRPAGAGGEALPLTFFLGEFFRTHSRAYARAAHSACAHNRTRLPLFPLTRPASLPRVQNKSQPRREEAESGSGSQTSNPFAPALPGLLICLLSLTRRARDP
jgi:hypothetical protein